MFVYLIHAWLRNILSSFIFQICNHRAREPIKKYHVRNIISIHPTMERICLRYVLFHVNFNGISMQEGVLTQEKNNCCLKMLCQILAIISELVYWIHLSVTQLLGHLYFCSLSRFKGRLGRQTIINLKSLFSFF